MCFPLSTIGSVIKEDPHSAQGMEPNQMLKMCLVQGSWFCSSCVRSGRAGKAAGSGKALTGKAEGSGKAAGKKAEGLGKPPTAKAAAKKAEGSGKGPVAKGVARELAARSPGKGPKIGGGDGVGAEGNSQLQSPQKVSPGRVHMAAPSSRGMTAARRERNSNKHKRLFDGEPGGLKVGALPLGGPPPPPPQALEIWGCIKCPGSGWQVSWQRRNIWVLGWKESKNYVMLAHL